MAIEIKTAGNKIEVSSPYHPHFPKRARKLGGDWNGSANVWIFDARDENRVRDLCLEIFGDDGRPVLPGDLVTIRATWAESDTAYSLTCYVAGRQVARAFDRDGGAQLGEGVIELEGGFGSNGSRKNPSLSVDAGTVVEIRDVPRPAAEKAVEAGGDLGATVEIMIDAAPALVDRGTLEAERAKLVARIAEIDAELDGLTE